MLTAEQAILSIEFQMNAVTDPEEKEKLNNWMLGVTESIEKRKVRLHNLLNSRERYCIKSKPKKAPRSKPRDFY